MSAAGDKDDWRSWSKVGDEVTHIRLREWADVLVIAPLSANTLAKIAQVCLRLSLQVCTNPPTAAVLYCLFQEPSFEAFVHCKIR